MNSTQSADIYAFPSSLLIEQALVASQVEFVRLDANLLYLPKLSTPKYIWGTQPSCQSAAGSKIAHYKEFSKLVLQNLGIPTPPAVCVYDEANLPELETLKYPVVIKPAHESRSRGLIRNCPTAAKAGRHALEIIKNFLQPALVETQINSREFRLLCIDYTLVGALEKVGPQKHRETIDIQLVHPDIKNMAEKLAQHLGLCVTAIDILAEDLFLPLAQQKIAVLDINSNPGLQSFHQPQVGKSLNAAQLLVNHIKNHT